MKYKSLIVNSFVVITVLGLFGTLFPNTVNILDIKKAQAEEACPASIPSSSLVIRRDGPTGQVLGSYENEGAGYDENGNETGVPSTFATLSVPEGTILHYSGNTQGVMPVNRSPGSTHSFSGGGTTVLSPSNYAGYYPSNYYFSKQSSLTGRTDPVTSQLMIAVGGHNSCWGGFEDGSTMTIVQIQVSDLPPGNPTPTLRTATNSLAVVKNPSVSLLADGLPSATVPVNGYATFTWSTDAVNVGDSCSASNNNTGSGNVDETWNGPKNGQTVTPPPDQLPDVNGGTQQVGPFESSEVGTHTYSIVCYGFNGAVSASSSVQIIVGDTASYVCSTSPSTQTVTRGSNGSVTINTSALNGYSSAVTFTSNISPGSGTPPTLTFANNGQVPPAVTTAIVSTDSGTSLGTYSISFTGTGGVNCPPVTFIVTDGVPNAQITCDGNQGNCDVAFGGSSNIEWDSLNVSNCDIYVTIGTGIPFLWQSTLNGSQNYGPVNADTALDMYCDGPYGTATDRVTLNVEQTSNLNPPLFPQSSNGVCNQIGFSWQAPEGTAPNSYNIYRRTSPGTFGPTDLIGNTNVLTYTQIPPAVAPNILYYYGVSAVYNGGESIVVPAQNGGISLDECVADLDGSDKDLVRVNNRTSVFEGDPLCNGASDVPTNYDIAAAGDSLIFRICVRNSGNVDLTNVTLTELPNANEFTQNLTNYAFITSPRYEDDPYVSTCSGSPSGMTWVIGNMPATNPFTSCQIYVTATVATPTGPDGELYRFQNVANITANSVAGPITKQVRSALLLFAKGSGIPDRNETAP